MKVDDVLDNVCKMIDEAGFTEMELKQFSSGIGQLVHDTLSTSGSILSQIKTSLKTRLGDNISGCSPDEHIVYPNNENFSKGNDKTKTVDAFLFDDDELDELDTSGKLSRQFCTKCSSESIEDYDIISHSFGLNELESIYGNILAPDLSGKVLVDIGSRLGVVLYSGYTLSNIEKFVGIEINEYFHQIQTDIVQEFNMGDRISLVNKDVRECRDILESADIVILHNVFEFFTDSKKDMESSWEIIKASLKPGTLILSSPSLESLFQRSSLPWDPNWCHLDGQSVDDSEIFLYTVK